MITSKLFERLFPSRGLDPRKYNLVRERERFIAALNKFLPLYGINTYLRVCAFLATCGVETDYFKTTAEYASGADYEGRKDLGNTEPGDGKRFKGSGIIQTTGRYNFLRVLLRFVNKLTGKKYTERDSVAACVEASRLGVNVLRHPELLRTNIEFAVESACIFWQENDLNKYADGGYFKDLNGIVNRGDRKKMPLHWSKRNMLYSVCLSKIPKDFSFAPATPLPLVPQVTPPPAEDVSIVQPTEPVALTPTAAPEPVQAAAAASAGLSLKVISDKYLKHTPLDPVKNIAGVIGGRITAGVGTIWSMGLGGKLLLIVGGIIAAVAIGRAAYYYWPRLIGWAQELADSFLGGEQQQNG